MKLFIKRDVSPSGEDFVIFGESGDERYKTVCHNPKTSFNIAVSDSSGNAAAKIRRLSLAGANVFVIRAYKSRITLVVVPSKGGAYSYFYGSNWHVCGNIASKNFSVIDVDKSVVFSHIRHSKYCELDIIDEKNELFCVAAAVCVNMLNIAENRALKPA